VIKNLLKFLVLQKISNKRIPECIKCKEKDIRVLEVNHLNGYNDKIHERIQIYRKIINGERKISDLEVRCSNCNVLYEYERGKRFFDKKSLEERLKSKGFILESDSIHIRFGEKWAGNTTQPFREGEGARKKGNNMA
jgi:hypothetical protein